MNEIVRFPARLRVAGGDIPGTWASVRPCYDAMSDQRCRLLGAWLLLIRSGELTQEELREDAAAFTSAMQQQIELMPIDTPNKPPTGAA